MLLAALPGAVLLCIIHCSVISSAQASFAPSPYLCDHMVETGAEPQAPVSSGLVQALIQGFIAGATLVASALTLHSQTPIGAPVTRRAHLAEGPPTPPPRLAAA